MSIQQTLTKLGLNEKEVQVYLALLQNGSTKPSVLAKITKLNRATLYHTANSLLSKGIIAEDISGKVLHFSPLPSDNLEKMLDQPERELREKREFVKKAIEDLNLLTIGKTHPVPKIRFIEEDKLEKYLFDNLIKWQESIIASDGIWWGFQDQNFPEQFERWLNLTWETEASKHPNYASKFFSNDSKIEQRLKRKFPKNKRDVRFLENTEFSANMWVCGDYLIMIVTNEHPFYLLEIHDTMVAHNTREIFKKLWLAYAK